MPQASLARANSGGHARESGLEGGCTVHYLPLAAALAALAVAAALAVPAAIRAQGLDGPACPDAALQPTERTLPRVERAILCLLNTERRREGVPKLARSSRLDRSARFHSRDMVRHHFFAHERDDRLTLFRRIGLSRYFRGTRYAIYAENLGYGPEPSGTAESMVEAWLRSVSHRRVALHPDMRDAGIGSAIAPPDPAFHPLVSSAVYTLDLGRRFRNRPPVCGRARKGASRRSATRVRHYCSPR